VAREPTLSFVPDAEQRLRRPVTRRKYQLTRDHVRLQNQTRKRSRRSKFWTIAKRCNETTLCVTTQ